jgi:hypothetical protein
MTLRRKMLALAVVSVLVAAGIPASAVLQPQDPQERGRDPQERRHDPWERGPVYSVEGAWYGMTNIVGMAPTPTLDTFTSNAQRHGVEGSFLCTIPGAGAMPSPYGPLKTTPSGHGNWVRIGTNTYAFTAVRTVYTEAGGGTFIGWARFWGTVTAVSDDELTGTFNAQFYLANGTPISPQFTGTLERHRIDITFEQ